MTAPTLPTFLHLHLHSPTVLGVTSHDPLDVDLEATVDEYGLPYIQRHRLSARLRDAALLASGAYPQIVPAALDLLGPAGSLASGRGLQIEHARLPRSVQAAAAHTVHAAQRSVEGGAPPEPMASRIRDAYTEILTTTAIDADGAPKVGTLRQIRAVRAGTVLTAPLRFLEGRSSTPEHLWALAVMCVAFDQIGGGATRGTGSVVCTLDGDQARTHELAFGTGARP